LNILSVVSHLGRQADVEKCKTRSIDLTLHIYEDSSPPTKYFAKHQNCY